ncbi:MAG: hypothetical protein KF884_08125 [Fimbriimonadaceae bacterium]|nr:hypothetical protein [Fimbriimonadaceae bacterium]QYK57517.1 MAG: hypothetical protein KF884_08125 [Fimbriimonadaceae bacterium]
MERQELYSESEILEVVRRAAELQEAGSKDGYVPGLTHEEIVRMAAEAGIEPAYIEAALQERLAAKPLLTQPRSGEEIERLLPVEVAPEEYDVITESVKLMPRSSSQYGQSGGIDTVGRTVRGQIAGFWDNPQFAVTSRGGRTRLRIWPTKVNAGALSALWTIPLVLSPVVGRLQGPVAGVLASVLSLAGAWITYHWLREKARHVAKSAADSLEAAIIRAAEETQARLAKESG